MKTVIKFLDKTGDSRMVLDEADPVAMEKARLAYYEAVSKGSIPFGMKGEDGTKLKSFDDAKGFAEVVMVPRIFGG